MIEVESDVKSNKAANRLSWKNDPISQYREVGISLKFSEDEFLKIKNGFIPQQMEDKWFIFYEDDHLYFHRSWTGQGIFKAQIIKNDRDYLINQICVNHNIYNDEDDLIRNSFSRLINILLSE